MKITFLNHGLNAIEIEQPSSIIDVIKASNPEALATACAAKVNGVLTDLRATVAEDASIEILDTTSAESLHILRHTTAHILAEAVKRLYPEAKLTIGPSTETGFYYDFECTPFTKNELDAIEKEMKAIIKKGPRIERRVVSRNEAMEIMQQRGESYKVEILNEIPEDYRQIIEMRFLDEYTYEEIAEKLGRPLNTIKTQIRRAKAAVCKIILDKE